MSKPIEFSNKQKEAENYLEKHKINELFANITSHLVFNKPENAKESIIEYLEKLKKAKQANINPPTLFEETNIQSIFGMLDPSGKGHISYKQYIEGSIIILFLKFLIILLFLIIFNFNISNENTWYTRI